MVLNFFKWSQFSGEHQLGEIPETIMDSSFILNLDTSEVQLSRDLAASLYSDQEECHSHLTLAEFKQFLTEQSQNIFNEDLRRLSEGKLHRTETQLNLQLHSGSVNSLFMLVKIEGNPFIAGIVYICYELQHEYRQHLNNVIDKLEQAQNINQLILEGSTDYIYQLDLVNNICTFSPKALEVLPLETPTFTNAMDRILGFIVPEDRMLFLDTFTPFLTGKSLFHTAEYRVLTRQGDIIWISCHGKGMQDDQGRPCMIAGSLMDITEQKKAEEKIQKMLYYDLLTGLKNRNCYEKEMTAYLSDPNVTGSILCIDIKNFKLFNEIFGHTFGNLILKDFAYVLQMYLPENLGIYRLEGDEFLIHLKENNREQILEKITALQVALGKTRTIEGHSIYINFTIGIAIYPEHGRSSDELLKNADTILYKLSKYSNEKVLFFRSDGDHNLSKRYTLENELRNDIENQFEHFRVVYQPIIKVTEKGHSWIAAEALLRYSNPRMPDVNQKELIETLEVTDLIIPVGRWVLQQAIAECSQWNKTVPHASVHVNFAAQQLTDAGLSGYLWDVIDKYHFAPQNLICELTETSLINNFESAVLFCREIMKKGVGVALDDFGTGYSSFNYLRDLPISQIKIDKDYVQDLKNNEYNKIIISCLYDLSRNMEIELCVEGIETKEVLDILEDVGVELIQGFYFEHPLEAEVIRKEFTANAISCD